MFGLNQNNKGKRKLMGLTSVLEMTYDDPLRYDVVVDIASQLCTALKDSGVSLTMAEKVRVLKSFTRARVRAFMDGASDNYSSFKTLDAISDCIVQLL